MAGCVGLELSSLSLTSASVRLLAKSPAVAHLLRLDLRNNKLDAAAVEALAASPHLKGLLELELSQNDIGDEGLLALASSERGFPRLRRLRLSSVKATAKGIAALSRSRFPELRSLDLSYNRLDLRAARALAHSSSFPELTGLNLGSTNLDDRRAHALAEASGLPKLTSLDLIDNKKLTADGAVALIRSPNLAGLRGLDLSGCPVGTPTVEALCAMGRLFRDGQLRLRECGLTDESLGVLAAAPATAVLRTLDLGNNDAITDAGAQALAASAHLKGLRSLSLDFCQIGPEGGRALAALEAFPQLRDLSLEDNPVGDEGLVALARWHRARGVRELTLDNAGISTAGVLAVVRSGDLRGLWLLGLGGNEEIGDEGIAALANCPDVADLRDLDVYAVGLTDEGADALIASPYLSAGLEVCLFDQEFSDEITARLQARFAKVWV